MVTGILALGLLATVALIVFLLSRQNALHSQNAASQATNSELGRQLATSRSELGETRNSLSGAQQQVASLQARLEEAGKSIAEQKSLLERSKEDLKQAFEALASQALERNNSQFLTLAEQKFSVLKEGAAGELEQRKQAIAQLVNPLRETLDSYQRETTKLKEEQLTQLGGVEQQLKSLATNEQALKDETAKLVNALKTPHIRGAWGEMTLRRTAELAGMSSHCDFLEQESKNTETGRIRPDMIVKLPASREIVVDAKVPLSAYLRALEANTEAEREAAFDEHAAQVHLHVAKLAEKHYWEQFPQAPEFVVLFIPNDSFLAAAAERDPDLIEVSLQKKVVLATPTTFIALLKAIAYGWRQEQVAEHAEQISLLGQEFSNRAASLVDHLHNLSSALTNAVSHFNSTIGSFQERLLPTVRKFQELGAGGKSEQLELNEVEKMPRSFQAKIGE